MSTARSAFTEAIEEHLALKKQNASLEAAMPLARYDVGDPLDRYPGGPNRAHEGGTVVVEDDVEAVPGAAAEGVAVDPSTTGVFTGPSPEQAMEAATALEPGFADRPFESLNGLAPMLSLVEDIEDEPAATEFDSAVEQASADVLRFPGGVGPREDAVQPEPEALADQQELVPTDPQERALGETGAFAVATTSVSAPSPAASTGSDSDSADAPTGEQPAVLVIDTDEPIATSGFEEPSEPSRSSRRKPRFFGLGRKKRNEPEAAEGWFTDGPRDFNWD